MSRSKHAALRVPLDPYYWYRRNREEFHDNIFMESYKTFLDLITHANSERYTPTEIIIQELLVCFHEGVHPKNEGDWMSLIGMVVDNAMDEFEEDAIHLDPLLKANAIDQMTVDEGRIYGEVEDEVLVLAFFFYDSLLKWASDLLRLDNAEILMDEIFVTEDNLTIVYYISEGEDKTDAYRRVFVPEHRPVRSPQDRQARLSRY